MNKKLIFLILNIGFILAGCGYFDDESELLSKAQSELQSGNTNAANLYAKKVLLQNPNSGEARFIMAEIASLTGKVKNAEIDYRRAYEANYDIKKVMPPFIQNLVVQKKHIDIPALVKDLPEDMNTEKAFWMGLFYLGDGYQNKAKQQFEKSIRISNDSYAQAYLGLALIDISNNNFSSAQQELDKALDIDKDELDVLLLKAELYTKQNKDSAALPILLSVLKRDIKKIPAKKFFIAKSMLIQIYWRRKEFKLTEQHTFDLLKRFKDNPIANYYGAMVSFERKKFSLANNFLQQVLRVSPEHTASLGLMGSVKYEQGFYEQADFYLSSALANKPNDPELSKLLAATKLKQNQTTSALSLLDSTSTRESDPLILWLSGKAEIQAGNTSDGLALLKKAASLSTNSESMKLDIAQTYLSMGELDKAILELEKLNNVDIANKQKNLFTVYDYIQKSDFNGALREIKILISQTPNDSNLQIALGNIYIAMQRNDQAITAFKKAAIGDNFIKANLSLVRIYAEQQNFAAAKQALRSIIELDINHFQALAGLVKIAILENNQQDYATTLAELQKKHPQNPDAFLIEAQQQLKNKDFADAENTLKKVIQLDEKNVTGILLLTSTLIQSKKLNPAIFFLEDKLKVPELKQVPHLHYQLAILHDQNSSADKAIRAIKRAYKLRPDNIDYLFSYTKLLKKNGNKKEIRPALEDFILANPDSASGYDLLGDFFFSEKLFEDALKQYKQAILITPSATLSTKLFRVQNQLKKENPAQPLRDWLLKNPEAAEVRAELASYELGAGKLAEAIEHYEILSGQQPDNPIFLNNLAWAYQQVNNAAAIQTAQRAYKLMPSSPEIADTYGWILVNMGKLEQGLVVLNEAYSRKPKSIDIQYHLAYALVKSKQYQKARNLLEAILNDESARAFHGSAKKLLSGIP